MADAVRNLAQRSAEAAKNTAELIDHSSGQSHAGRLKVEQVAAEFRAIAVESEKINALVNEIHLGGAEQMRGVDQASRSIPRIEQAPQSDSSATGECPIAAEELNGQPTAMQDVACRRNGMAGGSAASQDGTRQRSAARRRQQAGLELVVSH